MHHAYQLLLAFLLTLALRVAAQVDPLNLTGPAIIYECEGGIYSWTGGLPQYSFYYAVVNGPSDDDTGPYQPWGSPTMDYNIFFKPPYYSMSPFYTLVLYAKSNQTINIDSKSRIQRAAILIFVGHSQSPQSFFSCIHSVRRLSVSNPCPCQWPGFCLFAGLPP